MYSFKELDFFVQRRFCSIISVLKYVLKCRSSFFFFNKNQTKKSPQICAEWLVATSATTTSPSTRGACRHPYETYPSDCNLVNQSVLIVQWLKGRIFLGFPRARFTKMTSPQIRVRIPARVLLLILPILLVDSCQRTGRHLLMPGAQERSAQEIITSFKNDFDLNVYFGLRKIGISRETGKLSYRTVQCSVLQFQVWGCKIR